MTNSAELLTADQVAERLGCSTANVRRLITDGRLPAYRERRGYYRVDPAELDSYVNRLDRVIPTQAAGVTSPTKIGNENDRAELHGAV